MLAAAVRRNQERQRHLVRPPPPQPPRFTFAQPFLASPPLCAFPSLRSLEASPCATQVRLETARAWGAVDEQQKHDNAASALGALARGRAVRASIAVPRPEGELSTSAAPLDLVLGDSGAEEWED